jgi:hypothetical protein
MTLRGTSSLPPLNAIAPGLLALVDRATVFTSDGASILKARRQSQCEYSFVESLARMAASACITRDTHAYPSR